MDDACDSGGCGASLGAVPLFPLPNVVLFPRAVLPLHIFEERYKAMTADALTGDRLIAMALLRPGWERNYYERPAIEPVVCVGKILNHERLPDGKFNFLLQGQLRATIERELDGSAPYRRARLRPLAQVPVMEIDLCNERVQLTSIFSDEPFSQLPLGQQFLQILASPLPTAEITDLIAFNLIDNLCVKRKLLAEPDPCRRVQMVVKALETMRPLLCSRTARGVLDQPFSN